MDKLKEAALLFQKLLGVKYKPILGNKGKLTEFYIDFNKEDFFHLIGLQYLKDLPQLKKNRAFIFDKILSDNITENQISKSCFYTDIEQRISDFLLFEELLDSNETVFKYSFNRSSFSDIRAEYLLKTTYKIRTNYIFIDKRTNIDNKFCRSFFFNDKNNYCQNQVTMTLLYKEKIFANGSSVIQLNKLTPQRK